jgi:hypothetical protein
MEVVGIVVVANVLVGGAVAPNVEGIGTCE